MGLTWFFFVADLSTHGQDTPQLKEKKRRARVHRVRSGREKRDEECAEQTIPEQEADAVSSLKLLQAALILNLKNLDSQKHGHLL